MLTVRTGTALGQESRARAALIAAAVRAHPLAGHLDATIVIGPTGAGCLTADDPGPVVMVLIQDPHASSPLARALVRRADALVLADTGMSRARLNEAGSIPVVTPDGPPHPAKPFLRATTGDDSRRAWIEVQRHEDLARALGRAVIGDAGLTPAAQAAVAEAVIEAVVATGRGYTRPMERPAG